MAHCDSFVIPALSLPPTVIPGLVPVTHGQHIWYLILLNDGSPEQVR